MYKQTPLHSIFFHISTFCLLASSLYLHGSNLSQDSIVSPTQQRSYTDQNYFKEQNRNSILLDTGIKVNLETPQASLENFFRSVRNQEYLKAAYSLNLNLMPQLSKEEIKQLVIKLYRLINKNLTIDWAALPDRPDGQIDEAVHTNKLVGGKPRRSIIFGNLNMNNRDYVFRLERIRYNGGEPVWVIASQTMENIDELYNNLGPGHFIEIIPDWGWKKPLFNIPNWKWIAFFSLIVFALGTGLMVLYVLRKLLSRSQVPWMSQLSYQLAFPISLALASLIFYLGFKNYVMMSGLMAHIIEVSALILTIASFTWSVMRFLDAFMKYISSQKLSLVKLNKRKNLKAKKVLTHISVARRAVTFLTLIMGVIIIFSQFKDFEYFGASLITSASLITVILGIAAQGTLGNIIAGIQIALTQPARIGDLVVLEGQWGYVEDIGFLDMVIRTWDERRIIMPLRTLIGNSFENWSLENDKQIRSIDLYVDYNLDLDKVRRAYKTILSKSPLYNHQTEPLLQVIESSEKSMTIRLLCSADDPFSAWNLQCDIREKIINFITKLDNGRYLAQSRHNVLDSDYKINDQRV